MKGIVRMIKVVLNESLQQLGLSMNKLATIANLRPNTVTDFTNGKAKRIDFETLDKIIEALNQVARERKLTNRYTISDVLKYDSDLLTIEI